MAKAEQHQERREFGEEVENLFRITLAPVLWAVHFVLSYGTTAVFCAKWGEEARSILLYRVGAGALTLAVLAAIAWLGWRSWVQWDYLDDYDYEHGGADEENRHEFLGHAAFLLSIISFAGVIYVALPFAFIETCR